MQTVTFFTRKNLRYFTQANTCLLVNKLKSVMESDCSTIYTLYLTEVVLVETDIVVLLYTCYKDLMFMLISALYKFQCQ